MNVNKLRQVIFLIYFFQHMKISMSTAVKNESARVCVMLILWIADLNYCS